MWGDHLARVYMNIKQGQGQLYSFFSFFGVHLEIGSTTEVLLKMNAKAQIIRQQ